MRYYVPETIAFNVKSALADYQSAILKLGQELCCDVQFNRNIQLYTLKMLFSLAAYYRIGTTRCDIDFLITVKKVSILHSLLRRKGLNFIGKNHTVCDQSR